MLAAGLTAPAGATSSPTGLAAQTDYNAVALAWTAVSGAASYNVYRSSVSGAETLLASGITLPASLTNPVYYDLTAVNGTTYYYEVTAVAGGIESARSSEAAAAVPNITANATKAYQLVASSTAISPFAADTAYVSGGSESQHTDGTISTTSLNQPAPTAVYQWEHWGGAFGYTLSGLHVGSTYIVRLHEAETYFGPGLYASCASNNCTGKRIFNVTINGVQVLTSFDIFAAAGASNVAIARDFVATANASGIIYIGFCSTSSLSSPTTCTSPSNGVDNAKVDGIEVFSAPPNIALSMSASTSAPVPGNDITYTMTFTNVGASAAHATVIVAPVPSPTCFKVGSGASSLGTTGLTVALSYSNDGGATYAYTPVSGACGSAASGYDTRVTHVKWTLTGNLSAAAGSNSGSVSFAARVP